MKMMENGKKENWERLIKEMWESGKSQRKWCEEKGISLCTLKYWLRKLPGKEKVIKQEEAEQKTRWLKLNVNAQTPAPLQSAERIEILTGKFKVIVPEKFNPESVASIMMVLAKLC